MAVRYVLDTSIDCTEQKETLVAVAENEQRDWKGRSISVDQRSWTLFLQQFLFLLHSSVPRESGSTLQEYRTL